MPPAIGKHLILRTKKQRVRKGCTRVVLVLSGDDVEVGGRGLDLVQGTVDVTGSPKAEVHSSYIAS